MNPPTSPPPAPTPRGSRLPLIIAAIVVLVCIGLICAAAIAALVISRLAPGLAPTNTPAASLIIATTRATPTTAASPTLAPCPTPTSTPTPTPVPINAQPGQPTSSAPAPPPAAPVQTSEPCVPLAPEPTTVSLATRAATRAAPTSIALATSAPTVPAGRTPLPTIAFSGSCARPTAAALSPSPYISSITMAQDVQGDAKDPINPTRQFSANSVFHAVVAIEDAPDNTKFKAVWYATDVGSAAPCNTPIDSFELASDGTRNLDFNLTPSSQWPPGLFRVEIHVNSKPDSVVDFTVR